MFRGPRDAVKSVVAPAWLDISEPRAHIDLMSDIDEILGLATKLFGNRAAAERWLNMPAMALDRRTPIDLMATPDGVEQVRCLLTRLDYGVYT